jgi:RimJ/RimL family protein N-acetyltransferase
LIIITIKRDLFLYEKSNYLDHIDMPTANIHTSFNVSLISTADCRKIALENKWQNNFSADLNTVFKQSDLCAIAQADGKLVHWTNISFKGAGVSEIKRKIILDSQSAYLFAIYTADGFRKKGITSHVIEAVIKHLQEIGIKKIYILIAPNNYKMLAIAERTGFKKLGKATLITIGNLSLFRADKKISAFLTHL